MSHEQVGALGRVARLFISRGLIPLGVALACIAVAGPAAEASFPGRNGVIAFTREAPSRGEGAWTIWAAEAASGRTRQLTHVPTRCAGRANTWADHEPSYSASGRLIVFLHEDACDPRIPDGIYVMRSDGTGRRLVLRDLRNKGPVWPAFSPGETSLGFAFEYDNGKHEALTTSFPTAGGARRVVRGVPRYDEQSDLAWSAGGRLALQLSSSESESWGHIATVAADGRDLRLVTRSMRDSTPDWSPEGRRIVFTRESLGFSERIRFRNDVFVARARGRGRRAPRRLTFTRDGFFPVWAPEGRHIAYVRAPDLFSSKGSLWLMHARDGRGQRLLARHVVSERISWQPLPRR
jgi:Tol biopolymer transport system component